MAGLISNFELTQQLEQLIPSCSHLVIISAFMTQPATTWLLKLTAPSSARVQLVGRFTPNDFSNGASDLNALRDCIKRGYRVSALSNLHAKIYQIDYDIIFNGSANLTAKGLALVSNGNLESCSKVEATVESKAFIKKIIDCSTIVTLPILDKMQRYLDEFEGTDVKNLPVVWPEDVLSPTIELFVSDFPFGQPGSEVSEYLINPSLPFAQIENTKNDFVLASTLFKECKAYRWLKNQIQENNSGRDLGFGQVSQLLHDALADDPAPYRKALKGILTDFYSYIKVYASDEIEVYVPGSKSQVIRFLR